MRWNLKFQNTVFINFSLKIYYICFVVVLLTLNGKTLYSQQLYTNESTGTATIIRGVTLSLSGTNSLDFGEIVVTNAIQTITITNQNGQKFLATGERSTSVTITYPATITLSNSSWVAQNGGTVSTLTFTSSTLKKTNTNSTYTNPTNVNSGSNHNLPNLNGIGTLYLWAGGSITVSANKPQGVYEGTFTISVAY